MVLDNLRDNIQAHPESRKGTLLWWNYRPVEPFKDPPLQLSWDTNPLITHTDRDRLCRGVEHHFDQRGVWSIFDRIAEYIQKNLFKSIPISGHERGGGGMMDHNRMGCVYVLNNVNHFLKHLIQIDCLLRIFQFPCLDVREVE